MIQCHGREVTGLLKVIAALSDRSSSNVKQNQNQSHLVCAIFPAPCASQYYGLVWHVCSETSLLLQRLQNRAGRAIFFVDSYISSAEVRAKLNWTTIQ